jgi:hypothetical protein
MPPLAEARSELGARVGRSCAATAPLEEKVQSEEVLPSPDIEHDTRCAQMARAQTGVPRSAEPRSVADPIPPARGTRFDGNSGGH